MPACNGSQSPVMSRATRRPLRLDCISSNNRTLTGNPERARKSSRSSDSNNSGPSVSPGAILFWYKRQRRNPFDCKYEFRCCGTHSRAFQASSPCSRRLPPVEISRLLVSRARPALADDGRWGTHAMRCYSESGPSTTVKLSNARIHTRCTGQSFPTEIW